MSLTKKRKQLIAASLAAMTAFGATVPAIVASAPAAFAAEAETAAAGLSGAGITADTAPNTYNVSDVRIVPNSTDFGDGSNVSGATTADFSERTVSFNFEGMATDTTQYVLVQENPAMGNWYGDTWDGVDTANEKIEGSGDTAKKTKVQTGEALAQGLTVLVQKGKTATFKIYTYKTDLATSVAEEAVATYTLNAPDTFASTAFAKAPTVTDTKADPIPEDLANQGKISVDDVVDNGDGTYSVDVNVNEELATYTSSDPAQAEQGAVPWVGLLIGNFVKDTDAETITSLYYSTDGESYSALTDEDASGAGGTTTELALYTVVRFDSADTQTRTIYVSTAQDPGAGDYVAAITINYIKNYDVIETTNLTLGGEGITAGTDAGTYTATGARTAPEAAEFDDGAYIVEGLTAEDFSQRNVTFDFTGIQDDTQYVLVQKNPAMGNWYGETWGGVDSATEKIQGTGDTAEKWKVHTGAELKAGLAVLVQEGKTATYEIYAYNTDLATSVEGTPLATATLAGPADWGTATDPETPSTVTPDIPAGTTADGEVTVSSATVEAPANATTIAIPDSINTYLTAGNSIPVDDQGGTATTVAPANFTLNVAQPANAAVTSITLPQRVVDTAKNGNIPLTINITDNTGNVLYTWRYTPSNTADQTPANAMAVAEKKMADVTVLTEDTTNTEANEGDTGAGDGQTDTGTGDDQTGTDDSQTGDGQTGTDEGETSTDIELLPTVTEINTELYAGYTVEFPANAPTTDWTFVIPDVTSGTYRLYADAIGTAYEGDAQVRFVNGTLEISGMASGETLSVLRRVGGGTSSGGTTIPGGGGSTTDPENPSESSVQLDTQIVYMIDLGEEAPYDFLVEGNNDTDNITVTSSDENVVTVALQDGADTRGAKYRVTTHSTGEATITVNYNGESATMRVVVYPKGGSITLDTVNYRMAPGNIYDIGVTITDGAGTALSGEQVQQMYRDGILRVSDSRTGSIVDLTQLPNGNFRVTGKNSGTCYIVYEVIQDGQPVTHASVRIDVAEGTTQGGVATRDTSWWADKSSDTTNAGTDTQA